MILSKSLRILFASTPIGLALISAALYAFFLVNYVYCNQQPCESISESLFSAIAIEDLSNHNIASSDALIIAKEKEIGQYQFNASRFGGRIVWVLLEMTLVVFTILGIFVAIRIIYKSLYRYRFWGYILFGMIAVCLLVGLLFYLNPRLYLRIITTIFEKTIIHDFPESMAVMNIIYSFAFTSVFLLYLAVSSMLYSALVPGAVQSIDDVGDKNRQLRSVLYVGALILVNGILVFEAVFRWANAYFVQDDKLLSSANQVVASFTMLWSVFFSSLLATAYIPAFLILRSLALIAPSLPNDYTGRMKKLEEQGFKISITETLPRIAAIAAPIFTGPIGEIISKLAK